MQRSANIHNPKFMIGSVLFLAIVSNTIFSLAFIMFLSFAMLNHRLFLDINVARFNLTPIIRNIMMPFALFEILLHVVYQIPVDQFQKSHYGLTAQQIIEIFGLTKYWQMYFDASSNTLQFEDGYKKEEVVRLCCKAVIYFILSLQVQILQSKSFERIRDVKNVGRMKGEAMTYRFNNMKIKKYLKYQSINLRKEQMMIKVKENCDKWRALFEKQAEQEYLKEQQMDQPNASQAHSPQLRKPQDSEDKVEGAPNDDIVQENELEQNIPRATPLFQQDKPTMPRSSSEH